MKYGLSEKRRDPEQVRVKGKVKRVLGTLGTIEFASDDQFDR